MELGKQAGGESLLLSRLMKAVWKGDSDVIWSRVGRWSWQEGARFDFEGTTDHWGLLILIGFEGLEPRITPQVLA